MYWAMLKDCTFESLTCIKEKGDRAFIKKFLLE